MVPGILGSQLTTTIDTHRHVWMNLSHLVAGHFVHLQLDESGRDEANHALQSTQRASSNGITVNYCLTLAIHWDVHAFWYDWRMDFELIASELHTLVARLYGDNEPIYLVAHTSGGLVALVDQAECEALAEGRRRRTTAKKPHQRKLHPARGAQPRHLCRTACAGGLSCADSLAR